jgi:L-ascorbate metabolism protein UlaG (beta-lactamase superfamily)
LIITHAGGPTVLIEVDGWRLLTDPTFDPAGGHYNFGWGTASNKLTGPAVAVAELPPIDAVPIVGDVVGFALRRPGSDGVFLWITGDTVLHRPLRESAAAMKVDVALVHVGGVRFPVTGPVRYTMTARKAVELIGIARPRVAVPVHYEGWSHFKRRPGGG